MGDSASFPIPEPTKETAALIAVIRVLDSLNNKERDRVLASVCNWASARSEQERDRDSDAGL